VTGDFYAAEWVTAAWRRESMTYVRSTLAASQLYLETLPLFTRGLVSRPDHPVLLRELRLLERTPTRMGKDQVTHPRGCHDDHATAVCGVLRGISAYLGYDLDLLRRATALEDEDDERNYAANKEARDQEYHNQFAARIFAFSGGKCWPR
jgi:phage shock protein PspC (stress-responsive transcriptional regulator)